jgi:hypothetical protein
MPLEVLIALTLKVIASLVPLEALQRHQGTRTADAAEEDLLLTEETMMTT